MIRMLDSDICIYIINNRSDAAQKRLRECKIGEVLLSSIGVSELYFGAYNSAYPDRNLSVLARFVEPFVVAQYDSAAAVCYGKIRADLEKRGAPIGSMDMLIAAHALSINAVLITNNEREYSRIDGLQIENWTR